MRGPGAWAPSRHGLWGHVGREVRHVRGLQARLLRRVGTLLVLALQLSAGVVLVVQPGGAVDADQHVPHPVPELAPPPMSSVHLRDLLGSSTTSTSTSMLCACFSRSG